MANASIHPLPNALIEDEQLLERLREGSPEAFRSLYRLYLPKVATLCRVMLRDGAERFTLADVAREVGLSRAALAPPPSATTTGQRQAHHQHRQRGFFHHRILRSHPP